MIHACNQLVEITLLAMRMGRAYELECTKEVYKEMTIRNSVRHSPCDIVIRTFRFELIKVYSVDEWGFIMFMCV